MSKIQKLVAERNKLVLDARATIENKLSSPEQIEAAHQMSKDAMTLGTEIENLTNLENLEASIQADAEKAQSGHGASGIIESVNAFSSDGYMEAFQAMARQGVNTPTEFMNSLTVGTDENGGFTVPTKLNAAILKKLEENNVMRRVGRVITTKSSEQFTLEDAIGTALWTAEEGDSTETTPTFTRKQIDAYKATSLIKISDELLQDSISDMVNYIGYAFGKQLGLLEEVAMTTGDGSGKPTGVVTSAELGYTSAVANVISFDDIKNLEASLKTGYASRGKFMMNKTAKLSLDLLKDSNGQYIWQPGVKAGASDTLLGKEVYYNDQMADVATGNAAVLFGDFKEYIIADRAKRSMQRMNELYAVSGQVGFLVKERVDAKLLINEAIKKLVIA
jgi:HK97 family phage major capsid protein